MALLFVSKFCKHYNHRAFAYKYLYTQPNREIVSVRKGARQPSTDYSHHHSYPNTSPQQNVHNAYAAPLRREHPTDLTENQIRKEAALVLKQASQVNCLADTNGRANSAKNRAKSDRKKG